MHTLNIIIGICSIPFALYFGWRALRASRRGVLGWPLLLGISVMFLLSGIEQLLPPRYHVAGAWLDNLAALAVAIPIVGWIIRAAYRRGRRRAADRYQGV